MEKLTEIFDSLPRPLPSQESLGFVATQLKEAPHKIGKDASGWPAILLQISDDRKGSPIKLEHLDVQHAIRCRITNQNNETEEGIYTVIRCLEADDELAHYFLHTAEPILEILGNSPTFTDITRAIEHLVELFRALAQPPIKSVSGLWAELFVIRNSSDPKRLVAAWHSAPEEKYDFTLGNQRIEVKSSSQRKRVHHFSLEQLVPPSGCRVVVASVFVERIGGGTSLGELVSEIGSELSGDPELQDRLNRVTALTLGNALRQGYTSRFDRELAAESLKIFDAKNVPKISNPIPPAISNVHFQSDLNGVEAMPPRELEAMEGIFSLLL